jgi:aromatase
MREVEHEIAISAPAQAVYQLIAEVTNWPHVFPPTVHVEQVEHTGAQERIRIWATANGEPKTWTSRRELDPDALRVGFRQEVSQPPVSAMGGSWQVERLSDTECVVRLRHDYRAVDDAPDELAWIDRAVDRNSTAELAALKARAESGELSFGFADSVHVDGSAKDVYDFVNEAGRWPQRLPHVAEVSLREPSPGLQVLRMDTLTGDGSAHTTESVRVCFAPNRIVYKQIRTPALMAVHTGAWLLTETDSGVTATSRHTVVLNPAAITTVLGAGADVASAGTFVRSALSANSLATLNHAKEYAERRG